jgi:hypothetical protein
MPRPKKTKKTQQNSSPSANGFFGHDSALRIIGFLADMIAIVTVLFAIKTEMVLNALPFILSPWILFPIWTMAAYTYLCWLHSHWDKNRQKWNWSKRFKVFIVGDLIVRFRAPYLLIPVLLLGIMLVWIAKSADILWPIMLIVIIPIAITLFIAAMEWPKFKKALVSPKDEEEDIKKRQERIDIVNSRWSELCSIIEKKFETYTWVRETNFTELFYVWGLDSEAMWYAFAKYATEHPNKMHFGAIRRRDGYKMVSNVLIDIEHLDNAKYEYFSSSIS